MTATDTEQSCTVKNWVDSVISGHIALPMIQRGSVWEPHKILDLWDTLLQGMPLGAMMTMPVKPGTPVFDLISRKVKPADAGTLGLLDGQQRTLAMLCAWPNVESQLLRRVAIWVDLADEPPGEHLFRLWAATRGQPFGYERVGIGGQALSKLSAADRRLANAVYNPDGQGSDHIVALWDEDAFMPWRATFPIPLSRLIQNPDHLDDIEALLRDKKQALEELDDQACKRLPKEDQNENRVLNEIKTRHDKLEKCAREIDGIKSRAQDLKEALKRMQSLRFPIIPVGDFLEATSNDDNDPPIAVLFKRIAVGGKPLSNEDYIFSVLKHHEPEVHTLVDDLLTQRPVAATYTANDLVMTAVRLHLQQLRTNPPDEKTRQNYRDEARIQKARFSRLAQNADFSRSFKQFIDKEGKFQKTLNGLLSAIAYTPDFTQGLPLHALPWLVDRFLFEVLLAWFINSEEDPGSCKLPLVRFLLWGFLSISDKATASVLCIDEIEKLRGTRRSFPESELMAALTQEGLAYVLPHPQPLTGEETRPEPGSLLSIAITRPSSDKALRGRQRFEQAIPQFYEQIQKSDPQIRDDVEFKEQQIRDTVEIYRRWWNIRGNRHEHPFLLWLQRGYVNKEFESQPALAGTEEDTPYDFDHILPQSNWAGWTGIKGGDRLIDFATDKRLDHSFLGNGIGNLRVWSASFNRGDGDASPLKKLGLIGERDGSFDRTIMTQSCIEDGDQSKAWIRASSEEGVQSKWNSERAKAFQEAIELRTYALYQNFYHDLHFDELKSKFQRALEQRVADKNSIP